MGSKQELKKSYFFRCEKFGKTCLGGVPIYHNQSDINSSADGVDFDQLQIAPRLRLSLIENSGVQNDNHFNYIEHTAVLKVIIVYCFEHSVVLNSKCG